MGSIYHGIHQKVAKYLQSEYHLDTLIETGSLAGESIDWALANGFERVYSIEFIKDAAQSLVDKYSGDPRVTVISGDSGEKLGEVLGMVDKAALVFLDAHNTCESGVTPPVMREIAVLNNCKVSHVIMVDDARLFGFCRNWPDLPLVTTYLSALERKVIVVGDVIVAADGLDLPSDINWNIKE